jgi:6-phosphogluconolactonase
MSNTSVETFADSDKLTAAAGERLIGVIDAAVAARGRALIVLTGGGNGNRLLKYLGEQGQRIDWANVHLFWGDERYVAEDDDDRNDKQAREALLDHVDIPARNVHAMPARDGEFGSDLAAAALSYE